MTKKRYEILDSLPAYGPMYVPISENGEPFYSEGVPVRFYKKDGTQWSANFQPGWTDLTEIVEFEHSESILVIARGTCYLMNPNKEAPIETFGVGYTKIFKASNGRLVLQDQTDLTIIEKNGSHWRTERISWDGLTDLQVENNFVSGRAFYPMHGNDDWIPFSYNLDERKLTGGSFSMHNKKKPWWRIF